MLQSSNGFIINASFIGLSTNSRQFFIANLMRWVQCKRDLVRWQINATNFTCFYMCYAQL
jgi:hypothetical protein